MLFLLTNKIPASYDSVRAMVVRAESKMEARIVASQECEDEGATLWMHARTSTCDAIVLEGTPGVILKDVHEG